jgi:hypothetical protein
VLIDDAVPSVLRQADTNGDGQLSFEEFAALLQVSFLRLRSTSTAAGLAVITALQQRPLATVAVPMLCSRLTRQLNLLKAYDTPQSGHCYLILH